jgi:hypothetical protein
MRVQKAIALSIAMILLASVASVAQPAGKQDKQKSPDEQKIEQQDKEWLHDLQGTYGG